MAPTGARPTPRRTTRWSRSTTCWNRPGWPEPSAPTDSTRDSAAVDRLAAAYPLALVTNGAPEIQARKLETLGLTDTFDSVVHAGYDTLAKPDPAPFIDAVTALGVPPASVVHVGNSVHADVWGADAAGMQTALLRGGETDHTRPHYLLASITDLQDPPWA
jgi:putative hydrolase of the HAD superfamily